MRGRRGAQEASRGPERVMSPGGLCDREGLARAGRHPSPPTSRLPHSPALRAGRGWGLRGGSGSPNSGKFKAIRCEWEQTLRKCLEESSEEPTQLPARRTVRFRCAWGRPSTPAWRVLGARRQMPRGAGRRLVLPFLGSLVEERGTRCRFAVAAVLTES